MKNLSSLLRRLLLTTFLLPLCFPGCALPIAGKPPVTRDRAFISYTPVARDSGKLRLAVKDLIDMKGQVTTAGSQYRAENVPPAKRDAACLAPARERQVAFVGKTNLTEFAFGTSGMNEYYGTPVNPIDRHRIPGGSSSGSAVAVANGEADVAFGTDAAGSVRVPAAYCGILGLKTTFGLIPLTGIVPLSPKHLDTVGPLARDIPRLVQGMDLLTPGFAGRYQAAVAKKPSAKQIRIGRLYVDGTDPKIERAIDAALAAAGFQVVWLSDRFKNDWIEAQANGSAIAFGDGWLNDRQYLLKPGVSLVTQSIIGTGQVQYNTIYPRALKEMGAWRKALDRTFDRVDFVALPTVKFVPARIPFFGRSAVFEGLVLAQQNTVAANYGGNPAIAIPIPLQRHGFPVTSLQLIGPKFSEAGLVNAARIVTAAKPALAARH
jgi:amidase